MIDSEQVDNRTASANSGLDLELELGSIYDRSLVRLRAHAPEPFEMAPDAEVFRLIQGTEEAGNQTLASVLGEGGRHVIEADVSGWLRERRVRLRREVGGHTSTPTGMRWFPFVAAELDARIQVDGPSVRGLRIVVRKGLRALWNGGRAWKGDGLGARRQQAYAAEAWEYGFSWEDPGPRKDTINVAVPLRFGGPEFDRMVSYPIWSFLLGTAVIGGAAALAPRYVALAALAALLTFMLQQWSDTERLAHMTLLGAIYLCAALIATGWALVAEYAGWWAVLYLPIPLWFAWHAHRINLSYYATCLPPPRTARAWGQVCEWLGRGNENTGRSIELRRITALLGSEPVVDQSQEDSGLVLLGPGGSRVLVRADVDGLWNIRGFDPYGFRISAPVVMSEQEIQEFLPSDAVSCLDREHRPAPHPSGPSPP